MTLGVTGFSAAGLAVDTSEAEAVVLRPPIVGLLNRPANNRIFICKIVKQPYYSHYSYTRHQFNI